MRNNVYWLMKLDIESTEIMALLLEGGRNGFRT